jgi:hypothetical protein
MEKGIVLEDSGYEAEYWPGEDGIGSMGLEAAYELHLRTLDCNATHVRTAR